MDGHFSNRVPPGHLAYKASCGVVSVYCPGCEASTSADVIGAGEFKTWFDLLVPGDSHAIRDGYVYMVVTNVRGEGMVLYKRCGAKRLCLVGNLLAGAAAVGITAPREIPDKHQGFLARLEEKNVGFTTFRPGETAPTGTVLVPYGGIEYSLLRHARDGRRNRYCVYIVAPTGEYLITWRAVASSKKIDREFWSFKGTISLYPQVKTGPAKR